MIIEYNKNICMYVYADLADLADLKMKSVVEK